MGTAVQFGDEIGLLFADVAVSARNLVRGTFNDQLENPMAIAVDETIREFEAVDAQEAAFEREVEFRREEYRKRKKGLLAKLHEQKEAVADYVDTGEIAYCLTPHCGSAVKQALADARKAAKVAALPEVIAAEQGMAAQGWQRVSCRIADGFIYISHRRRLSSLQARPSIPTEWRIRTNIRATLSRFREPGFSREPVAAATVEFIDQVTAARKSPRSYPTTGGTRLDARVLQATGPPN